VLGFATDNGRFASNNVARASEWQHAGLLVTSRQGMRVRRNGHRASNWTPCCRPAGSLTALDPAAAPLLVQVAANPAAGPLLQRTYAGKGALSLRPPRRGAVTHAGWYYNNLATLPSPPGRANTTTSTARLARGRSAWTSQHTK
jgi:hypothetical protein